ncbi:MAG: metallophosphoesterase [Akkermansia sp.]
MTSLRHLLLGIFLVSPLLAGEPWKLGIMGDTHDTPPRVEGSEGVALDHIKVINQAFINNKVELVIQLGDLADSQGYQSPKGLEMRHKATQPLREAGIPFYAVRGNHDTGALRAEQLEDFFIPKTGTNNAQAGFVKNGNHFAFRHKNIALYFLDIDASLHPDQLVQFSEWIKSYRTKSNPLPHCIVFSHRTLRTPISFRENLFGPKNSVAPDEQNTFYKNLKDSGVDLFVSAHLHSHIRAKVKSPDRQTTLDTLICAPSGNKILPIPICPPLSIKDKIIKFQTACVGYYIVTVYDDKLHVEFYSAPSTGNSDKSPSLESYQLHDSWDITQ